MRSTSASRRPVRLGLPFSGTTTPKAIASIPAASTRCRPSSPPTACFARARGPRGAKAFPAFTNGVRAPATIATLGSLTRRLSCSRGAWLLQYSHLSGAGLAPYERHLVRHLLGLSRIAEDRTHVNGRGRRGHRAVDTLERHPDVVDACGAVGVLGGEPAGHRVP